MDGIHCYEGHHHTADVVKYEVDKATGILKLDRPQGYSNQTPCLYGFIPRTLCDTRVGERCAARLGRAGISGDQDPIDICVLTEKPIQHGAIWVEAIPIGGLRMIDANQADDKIIAVLKGDNVYGGFDRACRRAPRSSARDRKPMRTIDGHCRLFPSGVASTQQRPWSARGAVLRHERC